MKTMAERQKFKFELTAKELDSERSSRKAANILCYHVYNNNNRSKLDKKHLAEELALGIANEIKYETPREETKLEQEMNQIVAIIGKA